MSTYISILLLIAILPSYIIGKYIYEKDIEKEPKNLLIKLFLGGALSAFLVFILSSIFQGIFEPKDSVFSFLFYWIIGVGLIEELCKFLPGYFFGIKSKEFDEVYDAVVYMAFSATGFATFENLLYVFSEGGGLFVAILRCFFGVPGHICYGIIMGYFLGIAYKAKMNQNNMVYKANLALSLIVPTIFHGIYDAVLSFQGESNTLLFALIIFGIEIFIYIYTLKQAKIISSNKETIDSNNLDEKAGFVLVIVCIITLVTGFFICSSEKVNYYDSLIEDFYEERLEEDYEY